ncbi:MAG: hypothetical protein R3D66_06120 [Alphaproteobacteria bacterium]
MNDEDRKLLEALLNDMIDGHWKVIRALSKMQHVLAGKHDENWTDAV